ncbi:MAG: DMT family transporter [Actinomycetota bacterium]
MISVALALAGAVIYGGSDFLGGLAARAMSSIRVTALNSIVGFSVLLVGSLVIPTRWSWDALLWGGLSGLAGAVALVLFYACLALGPMSILSPIMGLVSAVVPIIVGFARGERLSVAGDIGLVAGLIAVVLICFVPGARVVRPSLRGVVMGVGAGLAIGTYLVFIDLSPSNSGPVPLVVCFAVTGLAMGVALLIRRTATTRPPRRSVVYALLCGLTDGVAAFLFLLALRAGDLSVVSVINALTPAGTVVLAAILLRERIAVVQWAGLAVALVAAGLLALA